MAADHLQGAVRLTELGPALKVILNSDVPPEAYLSAQEPLPSPTSSDRVHQRPELASYGRPNEPSGNPTSFPSDVLAFESARERGEDLGSALELLAATPGARDILRFVVPRTYTSQEEVNGWYEHAEQALSRLEDSETDPAEAFDTLALQHTFEIGYTGRDVTSLMSRFGSWVSDRVVMPLFPDLMEPIPRRSGGPLRIGYISANLRNNNGSIYSLGWLENQSPEVETYALNIGPVEDSISHRFRRAAHAYYHLPGPVPEAARFIKSLGLDALIYTDIGMAARNYQFAAMRLAPVQCMGWGHPVTSGLHNMDYFLTSDPMEPANGESHYTEKLVRLPRISWCYPKPIPPFGERPRDYFGLPEGFVPLMCQNLVKCLPKWDVLLQGISDRAGFVAILEGQNKGDTRRTKERLDRLGVNAIWVRPLTHYDYLRLQASCSVSLDTPAWSGGYTTLQALALGTPVVTMPGEFMRGRHSFAMLSLAGASGLIASSAEEFVAISCDEELQRSEMARADIDSLFDDRQAVRNLEDFLNQVSR